MKQFQKIAIGLLGLTNPEMFIPRPDSRRVPVADNSPSAANSLRSGEPHREVTNVPARVR
jgi:hypothetical protein